jgi:hypothetical protein
MMKSQKTRMSLLECLEEQVSQMILEDVHVI